MLKSLLLIIASLAISIATAWINPMTDERAMYGYEGPLEQNWLPREVAGWPAPYLADSPNTSVIHNVGLEDDFRPGPFVATWSFWFLVVLTATRLVRRARNGAPGRVRGQPSDRSAARTASSARAR